MVAVCLFIGLSSCSSEEEIDYREEMRGFVQQISSHARHAKPGFIIIPQNGIELVTSTGQPDGTAATSYLEAIDGCGQEDLFFGFTQDDQPTPATETQWLRSFLDISKSHGKTILVTDYCSTLSHIDQSIVLNNTAGYVGFAAIRRELDVIPAYPPLLHGENNLAIESLSHVKNFLYLINPVNFSGKDAFIGAVTATNYDLIIMDPWFSEEILFENAETENLRMKANGGRRLVIAYLSIGEAENYRYYWQPDWKPGNPDWLCEENPDWPGNYTVKYWEPEWQTIIHESLDQVLAAGFDGVYLDIIDGYERFE